MIVYTTDFFRNPFYVFDLIVIYVALVLVWRLVRVVHGLATSIELQHKRQHEKLHKEKEMMHERIVTTRRNDQSRALYFAEYHKMLNDLGVTHDPRSFDSATQEDSDDDTIADMTKKLEEEKHRRSKAESMYVECFERFENTLDNLNKHIEVIGSHESHGHASTPNSKITPHGG